VANLPAPVPEDAAEGPLSAPAGARLLVVDDEPRICRAIANAMARAGFHVLTADDGAPALELAAQASPDLAIIDLHMPTPGLDVVEQLRARLGPAIHLAVLSGHDDEETRAACAAVGADELMSKPVNIGELRSRMVAAARAQQAHVEARLARERTERRLAYGAEVAAMIAHDLEGGLAGARSSLSSLEGAVQLGEDQTAALAAAAQALRRMSALIANLVELARFEDPALRPQAVARNVRALLDQVIEVHRAGPARGVRFEIECEPALAGVFDPALLERALHTLVGNAIRHCGADGRIRLSARTWDSMTPSGLELTVWNGGPPVPDAQVQQLFARDVPGASGERSSGLHFCRLVCEAHGGAIAYRTVDGGAAFTIRLPGRG